jgi:electron transfer flavoprotein alpha subunit
VQARIHGEEKGDVIASPDKVGGRISGRFGKRKNIMAENIWVLPEINPADGEIGKLSLGLLSAARNTAAKNGGQISAVFFTDNTLPIPDILPKYGVARVITYKDSLFKRFTVEAYAAALLPLLRREKPWLFIMGSTAIGSQLAPRLAALLETGLVTDCVKMDFSNPEQPFFYRSVYGGQLYQEITLQTAKTILVTLNKESLFVLPPAAIAGKIKTEIIEPKLPASLSKTAHLEYLPVDFQTVDVAEADTIVSAGMGATTDGLYPLVAELAALVEGVIGTTRPVVDSGKIPRDRLIGQTGKTVSPDFYLALGISGATHHTGGIQASGKIVAVNRDPQAPIFHSADAGVVADLKEVLPRLIQRIKKAKADGEIL